MARKRYKKRSIILTLPLQRSHILCRFLRLDLERQFRFRGWRSVAKW